MTVAPADEATAKLASSYTVSAMVEKVSKQTQSGGYARWKAVLKPQAAAGGNFTVTAACSACAARSPRRREKMLQSKKNIDPSMDPVALA